MKNKIIIGFLTLALIIGGVIAIPLQASADNGVKAGWFSKMEKFGSSIMGRFFHKQASTTKEKENIQGDDNESDDNCLPPGIKHAPGIAKRIENGKGLPPGQLKKLAKCENATSTPRTATSTKPHNKPPRSLPVIDTTAPNIIFSTALGLHATSTRIIWVTNEASDSKVWVSTTTPVVTTGTANGSSSSLSYYHDLSLGTLATSTTYYYAITSADASGNTATSTGSFLTLEN